MRLVEQGTTNGIVAGEKVVVYTPKGIDTLTTQDNGFINGLITDVKKNAVTANHAIVWITPSGQLTNADNIKSAKIYNSLGQEVRNILPSQNIIKNLAAGIYYLNIIEVNKESYTLKFIMLENGKISGTTQHLRSVTAVKPGSLSKTSATTVIDSILTIDSYNIVGTKLLASYSTTQNPVAFGNFQVIVKTDAKITVQNVETKTNDAPSKITINGKEYNSANGIFNLRIPKEKQCSITARLLKKDGTINSYKRTTIINTKVNTNDTLNVVSYYLYDPKTKKIVDSLYVGNIITDTTAAGYIYTKEFSPTKFKDLSYVANFVTGTNGLEYMGLKTFMQQPNKKIWIASHGPTGYEYPVTAADQEAIKQLILTEIYPIIDQKYQPLIYLEDPNNWGTLPIKQQGTLVIEPATGFYNGSGSGSGAGTIGWSIAEISQDAWQNPLYNSGKLQEILTGLCAPNGVDEVGVAQFFGITVLSGMAGTKTLTPMDLKIYKMAETYTPNTQIDAILGQ